MKNLISFTHSDNQPLPDNCKFEDLKLSEDYTKIYKDNVCIITLCNLPKNNNNCKLYSYFLENINKKVNVKIVINNIILEKLIFNGDEIPSRISFFKLLNRNHKRIYKISECIQDIFKSDSSKYLNINDYILNKYKKFSLNLYQIKNLLWMENLEKKANIKVSYLKPNFIKLGNVYADLDKGFFKLSSELNNNCVDYFSFKGGALLDSDNTGKHLCMLLHCLNNTPKNYINLNKFNINDFKFNDNYLKINANLIICKYENFDIWKKNINFHSPNSKIIFINNKTTFDKLTYYDILNSNFIIISLKFISNESIYNEVCNKFYYNPKNISENIESLAREYYRKYDFISKKKPFISHFHWYRIIFDNCFEDFNLFQSSFQTSILKTLSSEYRWCISSTNMNFNENNFKNILSLLMSDYKFPSNNLFKNIVTQYLFRHNNIPKTLTNNITWLNFNEAENKIINKIINNYKFKKNDLNNIQLKKICNCIQVNSKSEIIFEKNIKEIENNIIESNKNTINLINKNYNCPKIVQNYFNKQSYYHNILERENKCCICLNEIDELKHNDIPCITKCGHLFCCNCFNKTLMYSDKCPKCRKKIGYDSIYLTDYLKNIKNINLENTYGTKIGYLFKNFISNKYYNKIIIVSQFTDVLYKINEILKKKNMKCDIIVDENKYTLNENIALVSFTLNKFPIFNNYSIIIFLDPLYNDPLNLQEKNIINANNSLIQISKLYMKSSPEEYLQ